MPRTKKKWWSATPQVFSPKDRERGSIAGDADARVYNAAFVSQRYAHCVS